MDLAALNGKISPIAEDIAVKGGFEFVKTEVSGSKRSPVLRIFIDRIDGLSVEHCADVSRELEARLDELDLIPSKYVLEVSSPGLERDLTTLEHFERFRGKLVKVKTSSEINGTKYFVGPIVEVEGKFIRLDTGKAGIVEIPFDVISKANLKIDLEAEFKQQKQDIADII